MRSEAWKRIQTVIRVQNIRYDKAEEALYIIDQTQLPNEEREIRLRTAGGDGGGHPGPAGPGRTGHRHLRGVLHVRAGPLHPRPETAARSLQQLRALAQRIWQLPGPRR